MTRRKIRVVAAIIEEDGRYLITQRRPSASLPLLWEFPGGRVEDGETDEQALARELREEMGIEVDVGARAIRVEHSYPEYDIDFRVYRCKIREGTIDHLKVYDHRWVGAEEFDKFRFPAADERSVSLLMGASNDDRQKH